MDRDGGDLQFSAHCTLIQGLDVLQHVFKLVCATGDQPLGQAVEHERVVWIGRMTESQKSWLHQCLLLIGV